MSVVSRASADEPSVARFDDEKREPHRVTFLTIAANARTAPDGAGQLIARLPTGDVVTVLASRGDAFLVAFDDPDGARNLGWIPLDALVPIDAERVTIAADEPDPYRTWYGWQMLVSDGIGLTLTAAGLATVKDNSTTSDVTLALGFVTYAMITPLIHGAHHNRWTGAASWAMRMVACIGGTALLVTVVPERMAGPEVLVLIPAAAVLVSAIDAFVLAYDTTPPPPKPQAWLMPAVVPNKDGATVGLVGSF
jgi:hypothetical protein